MSWINAIGAVQLARRRAACSLGRCAVRTSFQTFPICPTGMSRAVVSRYSSPLPRAKFLKNLETKVPSCRLRQYVPIVRRDR